MEVTKYQGYLQTHMKNQELIGMLPATAAELVALGNGKNVEEAYKEQSKQINDLEGKNYITSGGGISEYDEPTKPSDYTADALTIRRLRTCDSIDANSYGYWASIIGLRAHGESNCFEMAFTNNKNIIFRGQNESSEEWTAWQQIATTTNIPLISNLIGKTSQSLNQALQPNYYRFYHATAGFPIGYNTDNDFILVVFGIDLFFQRHLLLDIRSNRLFSRSIYNGSIQDWREF